MKKAPFLLLLVVAAAGPGCLLTPALAQQCTHEFSVLGVNSNITVNLTRTSMSVYLRPLPGFQGISMTVQAPDGEEQTAAFHSHHTCFQGDADFWEVSVAAWLSSNTPDISNKQRLYFRLWSDGCSSECFYTASVHKIERLFLMGHGPSAWNINNTPDSSCKTVNIRRVYPKDAVRCTATLSPGTNATISALTATPAQVTPSTQHPSMTTHAATTATTTSTTKDTSTVVLVAVVVVAGVALGVLSMVALRLALLVKRLKNRRTAIRTAPPQAWSAGAAGAAVQFSSLQQQQEHCRTSRPLPCPPPSTHKEVPQ